MDDLIRREDAIKEMRRFEGYIGFDEDMLWRIEYALKKIPPVNANPAMFEIHETSAFWDKVGEEKVYSISDLQKLYAKYARKHKDRNRLIIDFNSMTITPYDDYVE